MLNLKQVAEQLNRPIVEARLMAQHGELPAPRIAGRHPRWDESEIFAFTNSIHRRVATANGAIDATQPGSKEAALIGLQFS